MKMKLFWSSYKIKKNGDTIGDPYQILKKFLAKGIMV